MAKIIPFARMVADRTQSDSLMPAVSDMTLSVVDMLSAAKELRNQMVVVTQSLETVKEQLAARELYDH